MINPIEHSKTKEESNRYKVEPYVIPADVYGQGNLAGRGGWTWYTGSSSWMYVAGIKYILGLNIKNEYLEILPHIPNKWEQYEIKYKYENSLYNITVINRNHKEIITEQIDKMICNGEEIKEKKIKLNKNGGIYNIEIII